MQGSYSIDFQRLMIR